MSRNTATVCIPEQRVSDEPVVDIRSTDTNTRNELTPEQDALVRANMGIVYNLANEAWSKFSSVRRVIFDLDDLINCGLWGLTEASRRWNPDKGTKFHTYAKHRVHGAIYDEIRSAGSRSRNSLAYKRQIDKFRYDYYLDHYKYPTLQETAAYLSISTSKLRGIISEIHIEEINESSIGSSDESGDSSFIYENFPNAFVNTNSDEINNELNGVLEELGVQILDVLDPNEGIVISLYYFERMSLRDIGLILDLTESRICQIHRTSLKKLRNHLRRNMMNSISDIHHTEIFS